MMHVSSKTLRFLIMVLAAGFVTGAASLAIAGKSTTRPAKAEKATKTTKVNKEYKVLQQRDDRLIVELPNRMVIVAQELRTAPVVSAQIRVKTGSVYEQEFVGAGLSHFLEHLVSGGTTKTRPEAESNKILSAMGAQTNAATSLDTVYYYVNTTSDNTHQTIDLLNDWLAHSSIVDKEFAREQQVIRREFAMGRGEPSRIMWKLTQRARYKVHPARHPTIGYLDDFNKVTRDQLYDFYRRMYVPNNMVMVVVGDIDKQKVIDQAAAFWADKPTGKLPDLRFPKEKLNEEPIEVTGYAAVQRPRMRLAWPGTKLAEKHDYALDLLGQILGQGESTRLVREIRDQRGLVTTIDAYNVSFGWGKGFFGVDCEIAVPKKPEADTSMSDQQWMEASVKPVREAILKVIDDVKKEGVTEAELAQAKRQALARSVNSGQTAGALASQIAGDITTMHDPDYHDRYAQRIQKITAKEIQAAAKAILDHQRIMTVRLMPITEGQKPSDITREADPDIKAEYEPIDIDNRHLIADLKKNLRKGDDVKPVELGEVKRFKLSNGLRVLVQRSTLVPSVSVQLYQLGGLLADEKGEEGLANATAAMQMRGTKTRSAQDIARAIESLGASMSTNAGYNSHYASAVCLKDDLPAMFDLLADVVLNPSFPEDEWSRMKPRLLAAIDRSNDSWWGEVYGKFREEYFGTHQWSQQSSGRRDAVESFTVEDLKRFHANHTGAKDAVLAIVGDVDPEAVVKLAEKHLQAMPKQAKQPLKLESPKAPEAELKQVMTQKKNVAAVVVGMGPAPLRTGDDYAALQVWARIIGRFPAGWLTQELRGTGGGLAYAVWAFQHTGVEPGFFALAFNSTPDQVPEALARAMRVTRRATDRKIDEAELQTAKASVLVSEFLGMQSNSQRASQFALNELYGLGPDATDEFMKHVKALTPEQMQAVARKYLRRPVTVVLTDHAIDESTLKKASQGEFEAKKEAAKEAR